MPVRKISNNVIRLASRKEAWVVRCMCTDAMTSIETSTHPWHNQHSAQSHSFPVFLNSSSTTCQHTSHAMMHKKSLEKFKEICLKICILSGKYIISRGKYFKWQITPVAHCQKTFFLFFFTLSPSPSSQSSSSSLPSSVYSSICLLHVLLPLPSLLSSVLFSALELRYLPSSPHLQLLILHL